MYREFNNKLPDIFHKYFKQQKSLHRYQTRHAEDYDIPHSKTNFARKTGPMQWNLLEKYKTLKLFKNSIKKEYYIQYIIFICGGNV